MNALGLSPPDAYSPYARLMLRYVACFNSSDGKNIPSSILRNLDGVGRFLCGGNILCVAEASVKDWSSMSFFGPARRYGSRTSESPISIVERLS